MTMASSIMNRCPVALVGLMLAVTTSMASESRLDSGVFEPALASARDMPRLHSLLISHDGELLVEEYFNGRSGSRPVNVKSVSKSVMSALVGIAIERGHLDGIDQPLADFYDGLLEANVETSKGRITIGNLLSMQAGLETTSFYNYGAWVLSDDWVAFALQQPQLSPPGTRMHYSSGNFHILSAILTETTGKSTLEFSREVLGRPLGHIPEWPRDPNGIYFGGNNMELTPRQMLAFGEIYMREGQANGRQIVPATWVEDSLQPRVRSERDPERQYGLGWWMRDMAGVQTAYAWGFGGQFILLVPDLGMVVVTTSSSNPGDTRRRHTRALYDLLEDQVVQAAASRIQLQGTAAHTIPSRRDY
jgi:CubicO group peptidase (beta-lactamase class C family)